METTMGKRARNRATATDITTLTPEYASYYGKHLPHMLAAEKRMLSIIDDYDDSDALTESHAIHNRTSRIKAPSSMMKKMEKHGLPTDAETALAHTHDYVGVRIVCAFIDDVSRIVRWLNDECDGVTIVKQKDYITNPKPSGYRSYHVIVRLNGDGSELGDGYVVEVQIRTIAMDFWASLEHSVNYKHDIRNKEFIASELRRCADEIASTDVSMQTIKDLIEQS